MIDDDDSVVSGDDDDDDSVVSGDDDIDDDSDYDDINQDQVYKCYTGIS